MARKDPANYVELGETWYRKIDGLGLTPGHHDRNGVLYRIFDPSAAIMRCFACHSTGTLTLADDDTIRPRELGVRCEACHGPADAHAANPALNKVADPRRISADDQNRLCGECHRMPAAAGDATNLHNPWNARHEPLLLAESACFRESAGRLSCVTCHSPHARLEHDAAAYDARCRECHMAVKHSALVANRSCVGCHMPKAKPGPYLAFTNHRIAVYGVDPMTPIEYRTSVGPPGPGTPGRKP
ncbi:MAG: hypothetical protein KGN84_00640 [Acidobacteriota bacterium]|nr:hypothetical protein [Acidobacteriota bacterium]